MIYCKYLMVDFMANETSIDDSIVIGRRDLTVTHF